MQTGTVLAVLVAFGTLFADTYGNDSVVTWNQNTQCCRPPWATDRLCRKFQFVLHMHVGSLEPGSNFVDHDRSACTLELTWEAIAEKLTNKTINLKTGGLGTSMINGKVEVSSCTILCMDTTHTAHTLGEFE